jgi:hypothetical protein
MAEDFKLARIGEPRRNANDGSTVSRATVNRALTTLKLLFHYAEKCGYAVLNPTKGVAYLSEGNGRMRVVGFDEEIAYMTKASQPLKDIAQIILDTVCGPRKSFGSALSISISSAEQSSIHSRRRRQRGEKLL